MFSIKHIAIKNFRSISAIEFSFPEEKGLYYLGGDNRIEPRLGANGAGKSSFWDALCWVLYGTSVKGSRASSLIQWGKEEVEVELDFVLNEYPHTLKRTAPPNKILLDGLPVEQIGLNMFFGLDKERFLNAVMFGQGKLLFPDLSITDRGLLLDQVLDLTIWQLCKETVTTGTTVLQDELRTYEKDIAREMGKLMMVANPDTLAEHGSKWEEHRKERLAACNEKRKKWEDNWINTINMDIAAIELLRKEKKELLDKLTAVEHSFSDFPDTEEDEKKYGEEREHLGILNYRAGIYHTRLDLLRKGTCDVCGSSFSDADRKIEEAEFFLKDILAQIEDRRKFLTFYRDEIDFLKKTYTEARNEKIKLGTTIVYKEESLGILERRVEESFLATNPHNDEAELISIEGNPYPALIEEAKAAHDRITGVLEGITAKASKVEKELIAANYWKNGFNRIKLFFTDHILAALSLEIQSALSTLGLSDWQVKLATEAETKSGTTKLGVQISIKSPIAEGPWEGWSGGESQRLRLAIAMGLSSLIQRSAGVDFGFEVWDEPTAWLGAEGVQDLLDALNHRAETKNKQIWVVDHRALESSSFKEFYSIQKTLDGSAVYKTGGEA